MYLPAEKSQTQVLGSLRLNDLAVVLPSDVHSLTAAFWQLGLVRVPAPVGFIW